MHCVTRGTTGTTKKKDADGGDTDDSDETFWDVSGVKDALKEASTLREEEEDDGEEEFWDMSGAVAAQVMAAGSVKGEEDDDDDFWDMSGGALTRSNPPTSALYSDAGKNFAQQSAHGDASRRGESKMQVEENDASSSDGETFGILASR
jgi:hypothetical protein